MIIKADHNSCFVFDLDDTLYFEFDFLKSAYRVISKEISPANDKVLYNKMIEVYSKGGNTFRFLLEKYQDSNLTLEKLLYLYRNHIPDISLREGVLEMLIKIKKHNSKTGIITDGRSITQRNKIKALGLDSFIDKLVISEEFGSEKPTSALYESFMENNVDKQYYYFGDNIRKDFIAPKKLDWCCIGVLDEKNIHKQNLSEFSIECLPHFFIDKFTEIEIR